MNFNDTKKYLKEEFKQKGFIEDLKANKIHAKQTVAETCSNGTKISISFPGYKAYTTSYKTVYDYRVDITKKSVTTSLSHTNIITDIYNKIINGKMSAEILKTLLIEISLEGNIELKEIEKRINYNAVSPSSELLARIRKAHKSKFYNEIGNSFDLTIEELFISIKWIVLQEDINYPIPKYEGRKMPFARYLETIFITQNNFHTLEEVIERALSHSRPAQWIEMDYSFKNNIK